LHPMTSPVPTAVVETRNERLVFAMLIGTRSPSRFSLEAAGVSTLLGVDQGARRRPLSNLAPDVARTAHS
jgi:hypothetical protein